MIFFIVIFIYLFLYLFLSVLGLCFCARAFSRCGQRGPLFIAVCGPLTIAASLVAEHRLQTRRLSSCGSWAQLLHGMWNLPGPGLEPVSPALAGRFATTAPSGKPLNDFELHPVLILSGHPYCNQLCFFPIMKIEQLKLFFCFNNWHLNYLGGNAS